MSAVCNESFSLPSSPSLQLNVYLHWRKGYDMKSNIKGSATNTSSLTALPTCLACCRLRVYFQWMRWGDAQFHTAQPWD